MSTPPVITPPAMLGIVGGGQLGRYFVMAARTMGYRVTVLEPDATSPAGAIADVHIVAEYDDPDALEQLASTCAAVTIDFEDAPTAALATIADRTVVHPSPDTIAICQDRIAEKQFLEDIGAPVSPYVTVVDDATLAAAADFSYPAILKTARHGHDGNGQVVCADHDEVASAWQSLGGVACVLEQKLPLDRELSVVLARTADDRVATYAVSQNQHLRGVLDVTHTPAYLPPGAPEAATDLCTYIARELEFVGTMAVEMFVVGNDVYVNEIAPAPHNSGHYTLNTCNTSQFEQQVRAVCGLSLGETELLVKGVAMANLMGDMWQHGDPDWAPVMANAAAHLHLYGKTEAQPGRKMGHLTVITGTAMGAAELARRLRRQATPQP